MSGMRGWGDEGWCVGVCVFGCRETPFDVRTHQHMHTHTTPTPCVHKCHVCALFLTRAARRVRSWPTRRFTASCYHTCRVYSTCGWVSYVVSVAIGRPNPTRPHTYHPFPPIPPPNNIPTTKSNQRTRFPSRTASKMLAVGIFHHPDIVCMCVYVGGGPGVVCRSVCVGVIYPPSIHPSRRHPLNTPAKETYASRGPLGLLLSRAATGGTPLLIGGQSKPRRRALLLLLPLLLLAAACRSVCSLLCQAHTLLQPTAHKPPRALARSSCWWRWRAWGSMYVSALCPY